MGVFNGESYIGEQLESILSGTVLPGEVVISDDGSSDRTIEIARQLLARHPEVSAGFLRRKTPLGVTANFETALRATRGGIIVLADQDDVWERNRLEVALEAFEADPGLLVHHSDATLIDATGRPLPQTLFQVLGLRAEEHAVPGGESFSSLLRRNIVTGATMAFRRSALELALPFPVEWLHDEWIAIVAAAFGDLRTETRPLVRYRQHGANQVGAARRDLGEKVRRVIGPEGGRTAGLAHRSQLLAERLQARNAPRELILTAEAKRDFEIARARLPRRRRRRIGPIVALARRGEYTRFASQRRWDMLRDLLQSREPA